MTEEEKRKALDLASRLSDKFSPKASIAFIQKHSNLEFIDDLKLLYALVTDKEYSVDKKTYLAIAGAIAYVVLATDVIPDFIPLLGFGDDAFVVSMMIRQFRGEIERYKEFVKQRDER